MDNNTYDIDDKYAKFYLYGYNPDNKQSGFIKDFRASSSIFLSKLIDCALDVADKISRADNNKT